MKTISERHKNMLHLQLLDLAYEHPTAADHRFYAPTSCPRCTLELAHIIREEVGRRTLVCSNCGLQFQEREIHAA